MIEMNSLESNFPPEKKRMLGYRRPIVLVCVCVFVFLRGFTGG